MAHGAGCGLVAENDRARARGAQRRRVFVVGEEGEVGRPGLLDAGDALDIDFPVAFETAPEALGKLAEFQRREYNLRGARGAARGAGHMSAGRGAKCCE